MQVNINNAEMECLSKDLLSRFHNMDFGHYSSNYVAEYSFVLLANPVILVDGKPRRI